MFNLFKDTLLNFGNPKRINIAKQGVGYCRAQWQLYSLSIAYLSRVEPKPTYLYIYENYI